MISATCAWQQLLSRRHQRQRPGEVYNIGSGHGRSVRSLLEGLIAGKAVCRPGVLRGPGARLRPADVPIVEADYGKFHAATGWEPQISFGKEPGRHPAWHWREKVLAPC